PLGEQYLFTCEVHYQILGYTFPQVRDKAVVIPEDFKCMLAYTWIEQGKTSYPQDRDWGGVTVNKIVGMVRR
ncbi:unnamed protein product, partial [marine sediment metagenome]